MSALMIQMNQMTHVMDGTTEEMHPLIFAAAANSQDNPTWEEAMNGPNKQGYWKACETEIKTLESKDS